MLRQHGVLHQAIRCPGRVLDPDQQAVQEVPCLSLIHLQGRMLHQHGVLHQAIRCPGRVLDLDQQVPHPSLQGRVLHQLQVPHLSLQPHLSPQQVIRWQGRVLDQDTMQEVPHFSLQGRVLHQLQVPHLSLQPHLSPLPHLSPQQVIRWQASLQGRVLHQLQVPHHQSPQQVIRWQGRVYTMQQVPHPSLIQRLGRVSAVHHVPHFRWQGRASHQHAVHQVPHLSLPWQSIHLWGTVFQQYAAHLPPLHLAMRALILPSSLGIWQLLMAPLFPPSWSTPLLHPIP